MAKYPVSAIRIISAMRRAPQNIELLILFLDIHNVIFISWQKDSESCPSPRPERAIGTPGLPAVTLKDGSGTLGRHLYVTLAWRDN
jgi:hypothetical protein